MLNNLTRWDRGLTAPIRPLGEAIGRVLVDLATPAMKPYYRDGERVPHMFTDAQGRMVYLPPTPPEPAKPTPQPTRYAIKVDHQGYVQGIGLAPAATLPTPSAVVDTACGIQPDHTTWKKTTPPERGWYVAGTQRNKDTCRFWNGQHWSTNTGRGRLKDGTHRALIEVTPARGSANRIEWLRPLTAEELAG